MAAAAPIPSAAAPGAPGHLLPLTCVYPDVPNELAGLFEGLSAVMAAVGEATAVDVFLVVSGTRSEGPVGGGASTALSCR